MKIVKPLTLSLLHRAYRLRGENRMVVCVLGFFALGGPPSRRLLPEPDQWARLMKALPAGQALDEVMPKACAEAIVFGEAFGPQGTHLRLNTIDKRGGTLGPMPIDDPERKRHAGTYDQRWLSEDYPGLPRDMDWRLYNQAREDQRIRGWFTGGETFRLGGVAPGAPMIEGTLPSHRVRAFAVSTQLCEIALRMDTVWFVPGIALGVAAWRGELPVRDSDALDVGTLMLAYEDSASPALPASRYAEVLRLRTDPATAGLHGFNESQLAPAQLVAKQPPAAVAGQATPALPGMPILTPPTAAEIAGGDMDLTALMQQVEQVRTAVTQYANEQSAKLPAVAPPAIPSPSWEEVLARAGLPDTIQALQNKGRFASPAPIAPAQRLAPETATRLGRQVCEWAAQGAPLAGRDLAGADLRGAVLAGLDLTGCLFEYADFTGADMSGATLCEAVFTNAILSQADLTGVDLTSANLCGSIAHGARLARGKLHGVRATSAQWQDADGQGADLTHAVFDKADLSRASFDAARLDRTLLSEAVLTGSRWRGAQMTRCIAWGVKAGGADFSHSTWQRSALIGSDLAASCWEGARLTQVQGGNTEWAGADLRSVRAERSAWPQGQLRGVDFSGAFMSNCDFSRADLAGAKLDDACFAKSLLMQARLRGASARRADFFQAVLRKADFTGADLREASLYQAEVTELCLADAQTQDVRVHGGRALT